MVWELYFNKAIIKKSMNLTLNIRFYKNIYNENSPYHPKLVLPHHLSQRHSQHCFCKSVSTHSLHFQAYIIA